MKTHARFAGDFAAAVARGDEARDDGRWRDAVDRYRRALELKPGAHYIATQLGHALKETGDFPAAERAYGQYLAHAPLDPDIHLQMGHLFSRWDRADLAAGWYEKTLALDGAGPVGGDAAAELSRLRAGDGDPRRRRVYGLTDEAAYAEARDLLAELVDEGAEDLVGLLGNVSKELGRFAEAEDCYRRYRNFAATSVGDVRFDAALQSGHFEKIRNNISAALSFYIAARRCYPDARCPSCSLEALEGQISHCAREITSAIRA